MSTEETVHVNVGPLTSFNSLVMHLSNKIDAIRHAYLEGRTPKILFDLRNAKFGQISIPAVTALLSCSKRLRDYLGYPIPITMRWDPELQGFLSEVGFFEIDQKFQIFYWLPEGIIGGFSRGRISPRGKINPSTRIFYYADTQSIKSLSPDDYGVEKAKRKQKIAPHFYLKCSQLFSGLENQRGVDIIASTTLELIVNSLIHGEDIAFVGIQRTNKRVTISVCDSGIGFPKSLVRSNELNNEFKGISHIHGLLIGSLIQRNEHGLRLAISEVLNYDNTSLDNRNDGWVTISSYDTELRWQKMNWSKAQNSADDILRKGKSFDIESVLGKQLADFVERDIISLGYWKKYESYIVGTRIAFEITI